MELPDDQCASSITAVLPAITASASSDNLTDGNPVYFRLHFDLASQSRALALYAQRVLGAKTAIVIVNPSQPGELPGIGFETAFPQIGSTVRKVWQFNADAS